MSILPQEVIDLSALELNQNHTNPIIRTEI